MAEEREDTIYPTHTCFDDAVKNVINIMQLEGKDGVRRGDILIVHGIIAPEGKELVHAWLERNGKSVIFSGIYEGQRVMIEAELESYYAHSKVKETKKYTLFEAAAAEIEAGHYGPWDERYRQLCRDYHE